MIELRKATMADLPRILEVISEARRAIAELKIDQWQYGHPQPAIIVDDIEHEKGYVCCVDGTVAGYMLPQLEPESSYAELDGEWLSNDKYLTVHRMAIGDGYRGKGLAQFMFNEAMKLAKEHGYKSVRADTHRGNVRMRRMLEKLGYTNCGLVQYDCEGDTYRVAYEKCVD